MLGKFLTQRNIAFFNATENKESSKSFKKNT